MELEFLKAFVLILGVSALAIFALHRLRIPPLVGFILAGVLIGPHGLGLIKNVHEVGVVAEVGVILLLFTIGIEVSLKTRLRMKRAIIFGGGGGAKPRPHPDAVPSSQGSNQRHTSARSQFAIS